MGLPVTTLHGAVEVAICCPCPPNLLLLEHLLTPGGSLAAHLLNDHLSMLGASARGHWHEAEQAEQAITGGKKHHAKRSKDGKGHRGIYGECRSGTRDVCLYCKY